MGLIDRLNGLRARYRALLEMYGKVAMGVWFSVFGLTWLSFYLALSFGVDLQGALRDLATLMGRDPEALSVLSGSAGRVGIAYAASQTTKPLRLLLTLALTPPIARKIGWRRGPSPATPTAASPTAASPIAAGPKTSD